MAIVEREKRATVIGASGSDGLACVYEGVYGMTRYRNLGGESNVSAYEFGSDSISVRFNDGSTYKYTHQSTGEHNIARMKELAMRGYGLNGFINNYVRERYASKC